MLRREPLNEGDTIELIIAAKVWDSPKVVDTLSTQFTVLINNKVRYFFYIDEGVTWQRPKQRKELSQQRDTPRPF